MAQKTEEYHNEMNLYDMWKVLVRRKRLIIGLSLVVVISTVIISFFMSKIYRGEATISIWQNESISTREQFPSSPAMPLMLEKGVISATEIAEIIGNVDREKRMRILPTTHDSVTDLRLRSIKESKDKLIVIIDAKNFDDIPKALSELLEYINNFAIVKSAMKEEREKLLIRLAELSEIVQSSSDLPGTYHKLLKAGKLSTVGFNPLDLNKTMADVKLEKLAVEQSLQKIQDGYTTVATPPYVSNKPVKPKKIMLVIVAGLSSLFIGIILSFFLEYIEKITSRSGA